MIQKQIDSYFAQDIHIQPAFSPIFATLLAGLHVSALSIVMIIGYVHTDWLILTAMGVLGLLVIFNARYTYRRHVRFIRHPLYNSRLTMRETQDGLKEYLILQDGQQAKILSSSYAHPLIIIIHARIVDTKQFVSLVLWKNMLDQTQFRRLRVRIKHPIST